MVTKKDPYGGNGRALIVGEPEGLVKVICEKGPDGGAGRVLGVHMVGPWVTEQLGQAYLSVNWEATPDEIAHFIQPHPTLSETFGETDARPDRKRSARWLTSPCRSSARRSPRAPSPAGSSRSATQVAEDEVLFEVSTDKVDSEVPSPVAGVLAEILVPEGDTVDVGTRLAVISDAADGAGRRRPADRRRHRRGAGDAGRPRSR